MLFAGLAHVFADLVLRTRRAKRPWNRRVRAPDCSAAPRSPEGASQRCCQSRRAMAEDVIRIRNADLDRFTLDRSLAYRRAARVAASDARFRRRLDRSVLATRLHHPLASQSSQHLGEGRSAGPPKNIKTEP